MIEGDFNAIEIFNPGDGLGIISSRRFDTPRTNEKCDRARVAARIAVRLRIDADECKVRRFNVSFLHQFALCGRLNGLANVDEAARQGQLSLERQIFSSNHENAAVGIDNDAIDGEKGRFWWRHGNSFYVERSNVKTRESAGLVLFRRRNALEVLLAHPGGPYWRKKDDGAWTIPKGELEESESSYLAAIREFTEETGFQPRGKPLSLGSLRQAGGKLVHAWAIESDWDPSSLISNSFNMEWPPRSGRMERFPEIDRAQWFDLATAQRKILKSQSEFLDRLAALEI
jgi:predicted NUDIX family NTP pyrophosphohydrolase